MFGRSNRIRPSHGNSSSTFIGCRSGPYTHIPSILYSYKSVCYLLGNTSYVANNSFHCTSPLAEWLRRWWKNNAFDDQRGFRVPPPASFSYFDFYFFIAICVQIFAICILYTSIFTSLNCRVFKTKEEGLYKILTGSLFFSVKMWMHTIS